MGAALLLARIALATLLAVASVAKLSSVERTRESLRGFGVSERLLSLAWIALVAAELSVAVLLLVSATATAAAAAAAVMIVAFSAAMIVALVRGRRPDCSCFGQLRSRPVGPGSVIRNVVLVVVAIVVAVAGPGESVADALSGIAPLAAVALAALLVVLAVQAGFSYQLFRQNGRLLERVRVLEQHVSGHRASQPRHGLPEQFPAPRFELPELGGDRRSLDDLLAPGRPLALAFLDPDCGGCGPLLPRLAELRAQRAGELEVAIVTRGAPEETQRHINGHRFAAVLLQKDREIAEAYNVEAVPSAVMVSPDGRIVSATAIGDVAVRALLAGKEA